MSKKKVLLVIMVVICLTSIVGFLILYSRMPRWGKECQIFVMRSSSMEPTIMNDSFVVVDKSVRPNEIVAAPAPDGDIIAFYRPKGWRDPNDLIVHRAIDKFSKGNVTYFYTKGDANPWRDSWEVPEDYVLGKVVDVSLQPYTVWGLWLLVTAAIATVTGVLSLVLFVLIRAEKKVTKPISYPAKPPPIIRVCPQCGRVLAEEAKFCSNCGKKLKTT